MATTTRRGPARNSRHQVWKVLFISLFVTNLIPAFAQSISFPCARTQQGKISKLRIEVIPVEGGAEILTVLGRVQSPGEHGTDILEVPLISVLRDTLGSNDPAVHRLRYVWVHTYTRPTRKQHSAAGVPFLYNRVGNKQRAESQLPPPLVDLSLASSSVGKRLSKSLLQNLFFDSRAAVVKSSALTYLRNRRELRKAHLVRALTVLSLCESTQGMQPSLSTSELYQLQARLLLNDRIFGGWLDETQVERVYQKESARTRQVRSRNWELLRQRAEEEGLHFDPLQLPDGTATHTLLWVAREDLIRSPHRKFNGRFFSIESPWQDQRLLNWKGHLEVRYFDSENRLVSPETPQAKPVELIPLALYGLDYPKIPVLLIDFRNPLNAKRRELSERVVHDVARNVFSLSPFGNLYYGAGLASVDFIAHRRGADISQLTRLSAYSQLKLLLSLDSTRDPQVRDDMSRRVERIALNPMENDLEAESRLARDQYQALLDYARRPDGLPARLDLDRRKERTQSVHGSVDKTFLQVANILSFGLYTHREKGDVELQALLEARRRTDHYILFLREVTQSTPRPEVNWDIEIMRRTLLYLSENGPARDEVIPLSAHVFGLTRDDSIRELCLRLLYGRRNQKASKELLRLASDPTVEARWRRRISEYLGLTSPLELAEQLDPSATVIEAAGN